MAQFPPSLPRATWFSPASWWSSPATWNFLHYRGIPNPTTLETRDHADPPWSSKLLTSSSSWKSFRSFTPIQSSKKLFTSFNLIHFLCEKNATRSSNSSTSSWSRIFPLRRSPPLRPKSVSALQRGAILHTTLDHNQTSNFKKINVPPWKNQRNHLTVPLNNKTPP